MILARSGIDVRVQDLAFGINVNRLYLWHSGKNISRHQVQKIFIFRIDRGENFICSNLAALNLVWGFNVFRSHLPTLIHVVIHLLEKAFTIFENGVRKLEVPGLVVDYDCQFHG